MLLDRRCLVILTNTLPMDHIQRIQLEVNIFIKETHHTEPISRVLVRHPVDTALVGSASDTIDHIAHVDHIRRRVGRNANRFARFVVLDLKARVFVLQQQGYGAKVRVGTASQLALLGFALLGFGGGPSLRVMQSPHGTGGVVGFELIEYVGAVGQSCGDGIEYDMTQFSHDLVVFLGRLLEVIRGQQIRRRPDVGAHEEPASRSTRVLGRDILAKEEAFLQVRKHIIFVQQGAHRIISTESQVALGIEIGLDLLRELEELGRCIEDGLLEGRWHPVAGHPEEACGNARDAHIVNHLLGSRTGGIFQEGVMSTDGRSYVISPRYVLGQLRIDNRPDLYSIAPFHSFHLVC